MAAAAYSSISSLVSFSGQACSRICQNDRILKSGQSSSLWVSNEINWCANGILTQECRGRLYGLNCKTTGSQNNRIMSRLRVKSQLEEDVTIDNSSVLVIGGGGVGMEVTQALAKAGSWVTVFQRGDKFRKQIEELGAMLAIGDVMDPSTIEKAFRSNTFDAVVCTVGGGTKYPEVDKDGCINVIRLAKKAGVKRFLLVSSIGVGDSVIAVDEQTLNVLKKVLEAKFAAEEELKSSGLSYTIIRPGGLLTGPPSGNGVLTEDISIGGLISRADVASLIMQLLFKREAEFKTFSAIDSEKLLPPNRTLEGVKLFSLAR